MFSLRKSHVEYTSIPDNEETAAFNESKDVTATYLSSKRSTSWRRSPRLVACSIGFLAALAVVGGGYYSGLLEFQHTFPACSHPPAREEWRTLSDERKDAYISAVKCLHEVPSSIRGRRGLAEGQMGRLTDDFPWVHIEMSGTSKASSHPRVCDCRRRTPVSSCCHRG